MDNYTLFISQREVDIFFDCISPFIEQIAAAASSDSYLKINSLTIEFSTGQSFEVGVYQLSYYSIDDPKFMISISCEVEK